MDWIAAVCLCLRGTAETAKKKQQKAVDSQKRAYSMT